MQPLTQNGAWLDAIDAIDQFAAIGQYEMATASMIMLQSPYILMFGRDAYIRKLKEVASHAVTYEADANETLSSLALDSDTPSDAFLTCRMFDMVRFGQMQFFRILPLTPRFSHKLKHIAAPCHPTCEKASTVKCIARFAHMKQKIHV
jgi:hypothetical protein